MDWRKDFDKKFGVTNEKQELPEKTWEYYGEVKSFIENLLEQERTRIVDEIGELYPTMDSNEARRGYDQARADILFIINNK